VLHPIGPDGSGDGPIPAGDDAAGSQPGSDGGEVGTYATTDEMVWHAVETAVRSGRVANGDTVLVLAGAPDRPSGAAADVLRIVRAD
jgi:hypothetical protein